MTLKGLKTLHQRGIMHRDITRRNMLVLSLVPVNAAICDYGKAIAAPQSTDTYIGPVHTLAPEVWDKSYTNKVDVWAWAYAVAEVLGYRCRRNDRIDPRRLSRIFQWLSLHASNTKCESELIDLIHSMLSWNPDNRPTIESALQHQCWASLSEADLESSDDEETRRPTKVRVVTASESVEVNQPSKPKLAMAMQSQGENEPHSKGDRMSKDSDNPSPPTVPLSPPPN